LAATDEAAITTSFTAAGSGSGFIFEITSSAGSASYNASLLKADPNYIGDLFGSSP